jgi:hypothetical protein
MAADSTILINFFHVKGVNTEGTEKAKKFTEKNFGVRNPKVRR